MSYKQVSKDLINGWFKNYFCSIVSIVLPAVLSFVLLFANKNSIISAASGGFTTLATFILITCGLCLPIFIYNIKNNSWWKEKYWNYINSWKLTYFVAIYAFVYSILLAFTAFLLWLMMFAILAAANYYGSNSLEQFNTWVHNIKFVNWIEIIFYYGYEAILAIAVAFMMNAFIKKTWMIYTIAGIITLYNFFFVGNLNYDFFLSNGNDIASGLFQGFSYVAIYSFTSVNGWLASMGMGAFDFVQNVNVILPFQTNVISLSHIYVLLNFTIPFIIISVSIILSSMFFRWFEGINHNTLNSEIKTFQVSKRTFIINYIWIGLSVILVIIGIACTIAGNIPFKHEIVSTPVDFWKLNVEMINNAKYISGVFFLVSGIINLSLSAGYFMKNIYSNIENQLHSHVMSVYEYNESM